MARLDKSEIVKREDFLRNLFLAEPSLSMPKANDRLNDKFKSRMRPNRVYEIREEVQRELSKMHKANQAQIQGRGDEGYVAARNGQWTPTKPEPEAAKASLLNVGTGNEEVAKRVINDLQKNGLFKGRVEHSFNGYLVVVNA